MRFYKQLFSTITMIAVLCLPFAMTGCAEQAAPPDGGADTSSDMGEPEGGSSLP